MQYYNPPPIGKVGASGPGVQDSRFVWNIVPVLVCLGLLGRPPRILATVEFLSQGQVSGALILFAEGSGWLRVEWLCLRIGRRNSYRSTTAVVSRVRGLRRTKKNDDSEL